MVDKAVEPRGRPLGVDEDAWTFTEDEVGRKQDLAAQAGGCLMKSNYGGARVCATRKMAVPIGMRLRKRLESGCIDFGLSA